MLGNGELWRAVAAEIGRMPGVAERLAADHRDDGRGLCVACTTPGRGTAHLTWPCSLYRLAADASASRATAR